MVGPLLQREHARVAVGRDLDGLLREVTAATRMVIVCNPNNPTGNLFDRADILALVEASPGLVVVDVRVSR